MSSQYPILNDRPINKWKVAELKEELRRRNLMIKGLKDDLVRRLDEAIRSERAILEGQRQKDLELNSEPRSDLKNPITQSHPLQITGETDMKDVNEVKLDNYVSDVNIADGISKVDQGKATGGSLSVPSFVESGVLDNLIDTRTKMDHPVPMLIASTDGPDGVSSSIVIAKENKILRSAPEEDLENAGILEGSGKSSGILNEVLGSNAPNSTSVQNDVNEAGNEGIEVVSVAVSDKTSGHYGIKLENEYLKPSLMDAEFHVSSSTNQVYEICPNLGFQVQCESVTTDTLINSERNETKENLNANTIQLEPEVVRPESVHLSSNKEPSGHGSFESLDDQVLDVKQGFVREADDDKSNMKFSEKTDNADDVSAIDHIVENKTQNDVADDNELTQVPSGKNRNLDDTVRPNLPPENMESSFEEKFDIAASAEQRNLQDDRSTDEKFNEMTDMVDAEPLEKINLDQSSADDSIEDDMLETRHSDSDFDPNKVSAKTKSNEETVVKAGGVLEALEADIPSNISEFSHENDDEIAASFEKRKLEAVEAAPDNKEPRKRQRKWNNESVKTPQERSSDISLSTISKAVFQTATTIPIIDGSNTTIGRDTTTERVVPPSLKTPTSSLRIDHFVRPFTLKAVQELLSKTGTVCNFWMDHIKTHCYVTYTSIEEATETRNALYNLQWPPNGGRLLIAEFVDPEEVKLRLEAPSLSAAPANSSSVLPVQPPAKHIAPAHQQDVMQHTGPQLSQQQATFDPPSKRERLPRARSPVAARSEPPIVTLDDLFKKTKATPRIYYLPLTDEQVAVKLNRQRK